MPDRKQKYTIRLIVIAVLTIALLYLFFRNANFRGVAEVVASVNPFWLAVALVINALALLFRTLRWRIIVRPDEPPRIYDTFFAISIGFMSSAILPVRAGDLVRSALLRKKTGIRFSSALGTVVTERVLDLTSIISLFLIFVAVTLWSGPPLEPAKASFIRMTGSVALLIMAGLAFVIISATLFQPTVRRHISFLGRILPVRMRESLGNMAESFITSLRFRGSRRQFITIIVLTLGVWLCLTTQFYFVMLAVGSPLPLVASFFMTAMTVIGFAIPTPGGVGGFHKIAQLVLVNFYGFTVDASVAIALVYHVVGTLPVILCGTTMFAKEGLSWKLLEKIEKEAEAEAEKRDETLPKPGGAGTVV